MINLKLLTDKEVPCFLSEIRYRKAYFVSRAGPVHVGLSSCLHTLEYLDDMFGRANISVGY